MRSRRQFFAALAALVVAPKVAKQIPKPVGLDYLEYRMGRFLTPCGCRSATEHVYASWCPRCVGRCQSHGHTRDWIYLDDSLLRHGRFYNGGKRPSEVHS